MTVVEALDSIDWKKVRKQALRASYLLLVVFALFMAHLFVELGFRALGDAPLFDIVLVAAFGALAACHVALRAGSALFWSSIPVVEQPSEKP